ncbi:MAG: FUSC family protein [Arachnia sp.]
MDWRALRDAAVRGLKPGPALHDPIRLARTAIGMLAATIAAAAAGPGAHQLLILVGSLLGGVAALLPHERSRHVAALSTSVAFVAASAVGLLLGGTWIAVLPLLFVLLFAGGMLRAVAVGISMRWVVVAILVMAFAEIGPRLPISAADALATLCMGYGIMFAAQLLPPYGARHASQRQAVAALYRAVAAGGSLSSALLAADHSLALLRLSRHSALARLDQLVARAEEIGELLLALEDDPQADPAPWRAAAAAQLVLIAQRVERSGPPAPLTAAAWPSAPTTPVQESLTRVVGIATTLASGADAPTASLARAVPSSLELVRDELQLRSPVFQHALRLAVGGVIGAAVGLAADALAGAEVLYAGHGFWVLVAVALITFPDYGSTFSRGIGRTIGTVAGAILGIALTFIPQSPIVHLALLFVLYLLYLAFRSCGQPYSGFFVVAWLTTTMATPLAASTRALATLAGCAIAFGIYLIAPTWRRKMLTARLQEWAAASADRVTALTALWADDSEEHRRMVSHATVRARLARIAVTDTAQGALLEPIDGDVRWRNEHLAPAVEAMRHVDRQIAVLAALAPTWELRERGRARASATALADELRRIGSSAAAEDDEEFKGLPDTGLEGSEGLHALDRAHAAVASLRPHLTP